MSQLPGLWNQNLQIMFANFINPCMVSSRSLVLGSCSKNLHTLDSSTLEEIHLYSFTTRIMWLHVFLSMLMTFFSQDYTCQQISTQGSWSTTPLSWDGDCSNPSQFIFNSTSLCLWSPLVKQHAGCQTCLSFDVHILWFNTFSGLFFLQSQWISTHCWLPIVLVINTTRCFLHCQQAIPIHEGSYWLAHAGCEAFATIS